VCGLAAGLETVIDAAGLLRSEKGICFLIVGEGVAKQGLQRRVHELGLANVLLLSTQPAERLSQVFASADISLVTLRQNMGSLSVPSKSYAIMASARPILAAVPVDSEVRRLVEEANCGVCIPPEDPGALAAAIRAMAEDPEMSAVYGRNGRRYVEQHYSRADLTSRYRQLLLEVSGL
jgi:colanic acid biosynthesis glycosyl transferase WcaI